MRYRFNICLLLLCVLLTGCSNNEPAESSVKEINVQFSLSALSPASRADSWGDSYTAASGTTSESAIDISKLYGYVFADGSMVGTLSDISLSDGVYSARVTTSKYTTSIKGKTLSLQIIANAVSAPTGITSFASLKALTATRAINAANLTGIPNPMPMWGAANGTSAYTTGTMGVLNANFGTVRLLRPYAKVIVEVKNANDANDTFSSLRLTGAIAPGLYYVPSYVSDVNTPTTALSRYSASIATPASPSAITPVSIAATSQVATFYLPEQANASAGENEVKMYVTVNGEEMSTPILFRNYTDGVASDNPMNIMRNHCYRFTVTLSKHGISVETMDWDEVHDNSFEF